ncbi:acyltransferase family protein [Microvirga sp. VF16]|uniref:acyltransferase family protein n=1 Tax=Microvirga sp. VF16 TaxID=2807101 RepID=UPI00193E5FDC|nr:acyltransferase family protein [Microvirga sp. VF16]QRM29031.1 acyltransferase [Microvirga sp. VF16]
MSREFRVDVQALRGIAVLLVVIYHANLGLFPAGYLGVDIFFVISGFLITGLIKYQLEQGRFSFRDFYYRRAKRLLPAAYIVIALTTIAAPFFLSDLGLQEFKYQVLGAITFTGNIALWLQSDYFAQAAETKPLLHVWSLAIEEQYYLVLPAFLLLTPSRLWLRGVSLLLVISLALCLYLASREPSAAFYLLPTRFWEMAIGSVGALLPSYYLLRLSFSWLRLPALAVLLITPASPVGGAHPGTDAVLVCLATLALLLAHTKDNIVVWSLAKVGDVSYSLYLIHWPVLVYVRAAWLTEPPAIAIYGTLAFSLGASWALYRLVEEPFRDGSFSSRKRLTSGLVATSVILGLAPLIVIAATASNIDFKRVRRSNLGLGNACAFKPGYPPKDIPPTCKTADKPQLLVWGDSYAMAIVPGIAKTVGDYGVAQLTMSACGPAIGAAPFEKRATPRYPRSFAENCIRFNEGVLDILKRQPEIKIVAISSPFYPSLASNNLMLVQYGGSFTEAKTSTDLAVRGIKTLVEAVRAAGKKVVVVGPMPNLAVDIGECLERKAQGRLILGKFKDCQIPASEVRKLRAPVLQMLSQVSAEANVEVISPYDFLCNETICRTELNGKPLYRDEGHLSYEGSEVFFQLTGLTEKLIRAAR